MNFISWGKCNKNYKYMFLTSLFAFFTNYIFGYIYNDYKSVFKFIDTENQIKLSNHIIYHYIFRFLTIFIISFFLFRYEIKARNQIIKKEPKDNSELALVLIYQDSKSDLLSKLNISTSNVFMVLTILALSSLLDDIFYKSNFRELDFWMLELPILSYLNYKIFNFKIYKHHYLAIFINLIFFPIFKIVSLIILITSSDAINQNDTDNYEEEVYYYQKKHKGLIPIGIIFYFIFMIPRAYCFTQIKVFMDLKYVSPYKLLMIYGVIGTIITTFIGIISSFFKCHKIGSMDMDICKVSNDDENTTYFENLKIYWEIQNSAKDVIIEIFSLILGLIVNYLYNLYYILIIKYLTPVHIIFSNLIYSFFLSIIGNFYVSVIRNKETKENDGLEREVFYYIELVIDAFLIFGLLVYLEIIELNFCELNFYLRENIIKRSSEEYKKGEVRELINEEEEEEPNILVLNSVETISTINA